MAGYWNRPDETALVMTSDGFFRTGDIGVMSRTALPDRGSQEGHDHCLRFNVYPNEVEEVIASHSGVLECAAIGIPDAKSTEAVKIFVVRVDPHLTAQDIISFAGTQLNAVQGAENTSSSGLNSRRGNVGKILRRELRNENPKSPASA